MNNIPTIDEAISHFDDFQLLSKTKNQIDHDKSIYRYILETHAELKMAAIDTMKLKSTAGIFFLGKTGVGKSTLANSMIYGH